MLREILGDERRKSPASLRAVWALYVTGGLDEKAAACAARSSRANTSGRGASGCSAMRRPPAAATVARFAELARTDPSPKVRLSLASALQRLPLDERWAIAEPLAEPQGRRLGPSAPADDLVWSRAARAGRSQAGRGTGCRAARFRSCAVSWRAGRWRQTPRPAWPRSSSSLRDG